jgi:hypothetical protein
MGMYAAEWATLRPTEGRGKRMLEQCARAVVEAMGWLRTKHGIDVPVVHLTGAQALGGHPGIAKHADIDPKRRSDPGRSFPLDRLFDEIHKQRNNPVPPKEAHTVAERDFIAEIQRVYADAGFYPKDQIDGIAGPIMRDAAHAMKVALVQEKAEVKRLRALLNDQSADSTDAQILVNTLKTTLTQILK